MNRFFLLVICLFSGFAQGGANVVVPGGSGSPAIEIGVDDNCNLPAPTNLALSNITTTTMDADWDAVPGAVGYLVEAYQDNNNALLFSATETGTSKTITGLPSGTLIRVEVSAICPGGGVSGNKAEKSETTDIVIDVITMNFSCPSLNFVDEENDFVGNQIEFIISNDAIYHGELYQVDHNNDFVSNKFYFRCVWEGENFKGYIYPDNESNVSPLGELKGSNFDITCSDCDYAQVVSENNLKYCKLRFANTNSLLPKLVIELDVEFADDQYFFKIEKCSSGERDNIIMDNVLFTNDNKGFEINPNPISNFIEVNFSDCIEAPYVIVQILNTDGKIIFTKVAEIECDYLSLYLDDLSNSPEGLYAIRIISDKFSGSKWMYIH